MPITLGIHFLFVGSSEVVNQSFWIWFGLMRLHDFQSQINGLDWDRGWCFIQIYGEGKLLLLLQSKHCSLVQILWYMAIHHNLLRLGQWEGYLGLQVGKVRHVFFCTIHFLFWCGANVSIRNRHGLCIRYVSAWSLFDIAVVNVECVELVIWIMPSYFDTYELLRSIVESHPMPQCWSPFSPPPPCLTPLQQVPCFLSLQKIECAPTARNLSHCQL